MVTLKASSLTQNWRKRKMNSTRYQNQSSNKTAVGQFLRSKVKLQKSNFQKQMRRYTPRKLIRWQRGSDKSSSCLWKSCKNQVLRPSGITKDLTSTLLVGQRISKAYRNYMNLCCRWVVLKLLWGHSTFYVLTKRLCPVDGRKPKKPSRVFLVRTGSTTIQFRNWGTCTHRVR